MNRYENKKYWRILSFSLIMVWIVIACSSTTHVQDSHMMPKPMFEWYADHEYGNFREYSWRHKNTECGNLKILPDPTQSGRGYVYQGQVTCSASNSQNHRLYPTLNLERCLKGPFKSTFWLWADIPLKDSQGWVSFATYTNVKNWKDLFGVNLDTKNGSAYLVIFHVPKFGKGEFIKESPVNFPMKKWVRVDVSVEADGQIKVYQDKHLVASALKDWGPDGPAICEAHWGLYAEGRTERALLLNDDISIISYGIP
ncbi:MAG: hypothetical protein JSV38_07880 [Desulfobacterales bacterium]|nr:MAG: hypothetical protein JSV38_07880 [Desulfobacterales bacterium]